MKRKLRKFLSLLMVFALLCGMVPAAFAAGSNYGNTCWALLFTGQHIYDEPYISGNYEVYVCEICGDVERVRIDGDDSYDDYYGDYSDLDWDEDDICYSDDNRSWDHYPVYYGTYYGYDYYECYYCGEWARVPEGSYGHEHVLVYEKIDETWHKETCIVTGCDYVDYARHDLYCDCDETTVDEGMTISKTDNLDYGNTYTYGSSKYVEVTVAIENESSTDATELYDITYTWVGAAQNSTYKNKATLDTTDPYCDVTCYVTATLKTDSTQKLEGSVSWYATCSDNINVEATVYNSNTGYYLNEVDDEGYTSIEDQIYAAVDDLAPYGDTYILDSIVFDDVSETGGYLYATVGEEYYYDYTSSYYYYDLISEVAFYPTAGYVGKVEFPFTAYYYDADYSYSTATRLSATGTITFDVQQGAAGLGIVYTALNGDTVALDEDDFVDFWEEIYPYGTLDSVSFSVSSSKGSIYDAYGKRVTGTCYYDPTGNQTALDGLSFVPKSSSVTGAVEITFTAKGTKTYSSSVNNGTATGTVTILYTANEVTPIEYAATSEGIALDPDDFLAKYKEVMSAKTATANSLSIQFLDTPTYGSLYLNYNNSYFYNNGVELTDANVLNYSFSGNKNASRSIADLTYIPGSYAAAGESLRFACYYGSALKFIGTVNFGTTDPITVEYTTSGTTPVTFAALDFFNANLTSGSLYFGTPSTGTLYRNYANGTGTRVTAYDAFTTGTVSYGSTYSLNTLTYVPTAGYVGVVEIPVYSTYSLMGAKTLGVVKIYVGRTFTDVAGTSHVWAQPYIDKLSAQNIVTGTGDGTTYSPGTQLSYGEALTLIMRAVGYPEQAKTGTHWASGFLTKAYYDGLVSSSAIDLDSKVNRDTIATITAKALKLNYASSVNYGITGPSDSANGYVYALYNAGILSGVNQNGKNYYLGSNYITRAEISKIICLVADYEA